MYISSVGGSVPLQVQANLSRSLELASNNLQLEISFTLKCIDCWDFQFQMLSKIQMRKKLAYGRKLFISFGIGRTKKKLIKLKFQLKSCIILVVLCNLYLVYEACNKLAGLIFVSLFLLATHLVLKKGRSGGKPLATLCPI